MISKKYIIAIMSLLLLAPIANAGIGQKVVKELTGVARRLAITTTLATAASQAARTWHNKYGQDEKSHRFAFTRTAQGLKADCTELKKDLKFAQEKTSAFCSKTAEQLKKAGEKIRETFAKKEITAPVDTETTRKIEDAGLE